MLGAAGAHGFEIVSDRQRGWCDQILHFQDCGVQVETENLTGFNQSGAQS
jgi:hypothetical protein